MSKQEQPTRSNYAVDRMNLTEIGPTVMSSLVVDHMNAYPIRPQC